MQSTYYLQGLHLSIPNFFQNSHMNNSALSATIDTIYMVSYGAGKPIGLGCYVLRSLAFVQSFKSMLALSNHNEGPSNGEALSVQQLT